MSWLNILSERDYERDPPSYYDPKQRVFSLLKCMLIWVGINVCIGVVIGAIDHTGIRSNVYSEPWLLLIWMSVGAMLWWVEKILYASWLVKRRESSLRVVSRASIEKGVQP